MKNDNDGFDCKIEMLRQLVELNKEPISKKFKSLALLLDARFTNFVTLAEQMMRIISESETGPEFDALPLGMRRTFVAELIDKSNNIPGLDDDIPKISLLLISVYTNINNVLENKSSEQSDLELYETLYDTILYTNNKDDSSKKNNK